VLVQIDEMNKAAAAVPVLQASAAQDASSRGAGPERPAARRPPPLPGERASVTHKFELNGHEGYITVGLYPTGQPGEIFIRMAKEGSTVSGMMDAFATSISIACSMAFPHVAVQQVRPHRFEPSGWTGNPQIRMATSIMDYIFRWLDLRFHSGTQLALFSG